MIAEALQAEISGFPIYESRRQDIQLGQIGCRLAAEPYQLETEQQAKMKAICAEVAAFVDVSDGIYRSDEQAADLLNRGKPEVFHKPERTKQVFLRPDILVGPGGQQTVCEIETSPFGLGLAVALDRAYRDNGHTTLAEVDISEHVRAHTPQTGQITYSQNTIQYRGQLGYLAETVFGGEGRNWRSGTVEEIETEEQAVYRAFGLYETKEDASLAALVDKAKARDIALVPSVGPHLEEKALMAMLWDRRWQGRYRRELGPAGFDLLRQAIPPTWIMGQEEHFAPGLPGNVTETIALTGLSRAKRQFVLKVSGFDPRAAWSEGVTMLHQVSSVRAADALRQASEGDGLHVIQEFRAGVKVPLVVEGPVLAQHSARLRITPYIRPKDGRILVAKATGRSGTDFIHGSSDSINCAVGFSE